MSDHDETKCINCGERRPSDAPRENSVCAERSEPLSQASVVSQILGAVFETTFAQQLEDLIAEMGEEVRRQERARIVIMLDDIANEQHEVARNFGGKDTEAGRTALASASVLDSIADDMRGGDR